jgi:hypothetical protein
LLATIVTGLTLLVVRITWETFSIIMIILSTVTLMITAYQMFRGKIVMNKIHSLGEIDVYLLLGVNLWVIISSLKPKAQTNALLFLVMAILLYKLY